MKKYKAGHYGKQLIEEVEVIRETAAFIYVAWNHGNGEHRLAKRSNYENYFDTWEEAHKYLVDEAQDAVDSCRHSLERANGRLGNIKGLRKQTNQGE